MAFLIIKASTEASAALLGQWYRGEYRKDIQHHFIRHLGNGTYLTEPSGEALALAWSLRERFEGKVDIFVAEPLRENDIPYRVQEVAKCLIENPNSKKILKKVKGLKMKCSVSSNEISLDSYEMEKEQVE